MKTYTATQQQLDIIFANLDMLVTRGTQNAELIVGIKIMLGEISKAEIEPTECNIVELKKADIGAG
jgi:hypothetical protein